MSTSEEIWLANLADIQKKMKMIKRRKHGVLPVRYASDPDSKNYRKSTIEPGWQVESFSPATTEDAELLYRIQKADEKKMQMAS